MSYERAPEEVANLGGRIAADLTRFLFGEAVVVSRRSACGAPAEEQLAKAFYFTASPGHWNQALESFESAVAADANCLDGLAGVAEIAVRMSKRGTGGADFLAKAGAAARRAIELDGSVPAAHNALANVLFWNEWRWKEAEHHFQRAIELQPSFALAHHDYAWMMAAAGRPDEAVARMERSRELDPVSPQVNIDTGWILYRTRRFADAIKHCRRVLEVDPKMEEARVSLELSLVNQGRFREALAEGRGRHSSSNAPTEDAEREYRRRARDRVRKKEHSGAAPGNAFLAAVQYVLAGELQPALDWLEQSFERRELMAALIDCEPVFDPLRDNPRFQRLVARLRR
jgi:tetratricopeptide (TPR) repeat protein